MLPVSLTSQRLMMMMKRSHSTKVVNMVICSVMRKGKTVAINLLHLLKCHLLNPSTRPSSKVSKRSTVLKTKLVESENDNDDDEGEEDVCSNDQTFSTDEQ